MKIELDPTGGATLASAPHSFLRAGTAPFRRVNIALFLAGFATFSLLYCVQPLLPGFAQHFGVDPATSSLALSLSTGALAFAIVAAGALSHRVSRRGLMFGSMAAAALLNLLVAFSPGWNLLLAARLLEGLALGGVPAVAMAYLAEEVDGRDLGKAMGLYVAGTAFGGMMGRVGMGVLTEIGSWRVAMGALGLLDLAAAIGFFLLLPPSRHFSVQRGVDFGAIVRSWAGLLRDPALARLFAIGFILTSVFVALFNYAGFRLAAAPYGLGEAAVSAVFLVYGVGMLASSMAGGLADRHGRQLPLLAGLATMLVGIALTMAAPLPAIILGVGLVTGGFFIAHSVASGWVGRLAGPAKAHAASLYLLAYYLGSSIFGSIGGWFWLHGGWPAVAGLTALLAAGGLALAGHMREPARG